MTTLPQFINEHGKRMVVVDKTIADMCRKEGIDMEKENIVESKPITESDVPDSIAFDIPKRESFRNLTTSHKQHHTAPDGRRYVDTGKGWRRV